MKYLKLFENISDINKFVKYCKTHLDLGRELSTEYFYNSITLCIIDAVFSIGITYSQTKKVVERYVEYYNLKEYRLSENFPSKSEQESISDLIYNIEKVGPFDMASNIFKNRCRTSTHKFSKNSHLYNWWKIFRDG